MKFKKIVALLLSFAIILSGVGVIPTPAHAAAFDREQYYLDSIAEYSLFDDKDPQYITDEEFFGVWDNDSGTWKEGYVPYFYYEEYPELAAVENAAKIGDYETCKETLLAYYREKHDGYFINGEGGGAVSSQKLAQYESMMDNFSRQDYSTILGKAFFEKDYGWQEIEVLSEIKSVAANSTSEKRLKFLLCAGKKDGYRLEIDKSGENLPYVTATINGEPRTFYADVATYIDGTEADISHKDCDKILVEESVTSIGSNTTSDENTKNGFLQFSIPDLRSTDQITGATLHLRGRFAEDDIPAEPRLDNVEFKSMYVMRWTGTSVIDPNINYNKYMTLVRHYRCTDGEPGVKVIKKDVTNSNCAWVMELRDGFEFLADGYHYTQNEAFAFHAVRLLVQNAIYVGDYEQLCASQANGDYDALRMAVYSSIVWNLDKIIDSKYMTPEAYTIIMKRTHMMGRWLAEHWPSHFEGNNHGSYGVNGLESICFMYPEFRDVHGELWINEDGSLYLMNEELSGSVFGGWLETANYRRGVKAVADIAADGASVEGSTSYAMDGINNYLAAIDYGEQLNIDTSVYYTNEEANAIVTKGLLYIVSKLNPMLGDFQVGDGAAWTKHYSSSFKPFLKIIDNPVIKWVVTDRAEGEEPPFLTCAYDSQSTAVFRDSWADDSTIAAHFEARGGGSHNHNDDGNIVLFAYGNYLLVDPRQGDYNEEDPNERWVSSTRGHNTVEINNTVARGNRSYISQQEPLVFEYDENGAPKVDEYGVAMVDDPLIVPIDSVSRQQGYLYPEDREINTVYDFIRAKSLGYTNHNAMKEDFNYERDVLFLRSGYFVVTDNMSPEFGAANGSNHYKQLWHFLPDANMTVDTAKNTMRTNFNGRANLIVATVKNNENMTAQYKYGLYAGERSIFGTAKYGTFEQDKEETATFNTLLYPLHPGQNADVTTTKLELDLADDKANAFKATVTDEETKVQKDIYFYTLFDKTKKAPMTFGAYKTDGSLALGDTVDGKYSNAVLRQGSYLENIMDKEYVIYSEEDVEDVGVYWQLNEIDIAYNADDEYNNELDLEKLTIRANGTAKTVRLNGEEISFKQQGRYIYFGDEPIIDDEIITDTDSSENGNTSNDSSGNHATAGDSGSNKNNGNSGNIGGIGGGSFGVIGGGTIQPPKDYETDTKPSDTYANEISGHWAQKEISALVDSSVVQGYGDGTLGLNRNITRAQFVTMLVRALGSDVKKYTGSFADVTPESWYADYMETAYHNGWINGDGLNAYPERNITREEITKILVSAFEQKYGEISTDSENTFTDSNDISTWAEPFVNKAVKAGLINGMGNGEFQPKQSAKREQAMVLIYRLLNNEN